MMCSISPVGSRGSSDLNKSPAGEARSSIVSPMAALRPAAVKRCAVHRFAQQIAMLKQKLAIALPGDRFAVIDAGELADPCAGAPPGADETRARDGSVPCSIAIRIRREAGPSRS